MNTIHLGQQDSDLYFISGWCHLSSLNFHLHILLHHFLNYQHEVWPMTTWIKFWNSPFLMSTVPFWYDLATQPVRPGPKAWDLILVSPVDTGTCDNWTIWILKCTVHYAYLNKPPLYTMLYAKHIYWLIKSMTKNRDLYMPFNGSLKQVPTWSYISYKVFKLSQPFVY